MSEQAITDAILRNALELQRLSAFEEARADAVLQDLTRDLRALLASRSLSDAGKREIEALIKEAEQAINARYAQAFGMFDAQGLTVHVAERAVEAMQAGIAGSITLPAVETLASLSRAVMIEGSPLKAWWDKQAEDTAFRFAAQVRQGVINSETQERIVGRIVGRGGEPGVMDVSRRHARALVHTAVMSSANSARMEVYRKNGRFIAGIKWLATLDSHTCKTCAALDGQAWDLEGQPIKGTTMRLRFAPAHALCRCVMTPVPKSLDALMGTTGLDAMRDDLSRRASKDGPVAGTTTFNDFLARQSPAFVESVLGKRRADLYLAGKLTLRDLVSGTGRPLTLDELNAR